MKIVFWTILTLDLVSSTYTFFINRPSLQAAMFMTFAVLLLVETLFMIAALIKMSSTIGTWRQSRVNTKRLISQAFAFILFILALIYDETMNFVGSDLYEFDWLITAAVGTVSMWLLADLLWHLGTKEKPLPEV